MANADGELTLHALWEDFSAILRRRKAVVAVVALTLVVSVYIGLMFIGDTFEAQASLFVRMGRENAEVPVTVEKGAVFPNGVRKEEINSYIALLTSRPLLEATLKEIGYERFRPELPRPTSLFGWIKYGAKKAVRWARAQLEELQIFLSLKRRLSEPELAYLALSKSLRVDREKDADVIVLKLRLPDAGLARDALQVLTDRYLARHIEVIRREGTALQLFEEETQSYGETLLGLREKLSRLRSELGVTAVAEQKTQLLEMLKGAELGRLDAERERARIDAERTALAERRGQLEELQVTSKSLGPSAARARLRQSLADLQLERTLALTKYQPDSDPVRKVELQIADVEAALAQTPAEEDATRTLGRNPVLSFVESRLAEDEVRSRALAATLEITATQADRIKAELKRLDLAEAELQKLQLEVSVAESRFLSNASRREEARAQETLDRWKVANVSLLSPAAFGEKPVAPNRLLIMAMGLVGGLLAGMVVALLLEWRSDVIYCPRDLDRVAPGLFLGTLSVGRLPAARSVPVAEPSSSTS